uniref:Uncharacterized sensor-like histidine kinase ycf26 n=1 Tax=Trichogloeopsis pedicellata TaxID=1495610 RepID=A0A1G4P0K1_9FLOR|nr:Drug sensory protein A [Trichogloeopsis pedicellata]SCW24346.1 Drug sensory protein A [Trichogloeopsis pedicellata]
MSKDCSKWFACLDIYTRLLACTTVFISLFVTGIVYSLLDSLYRSMLTNQIEFFNLLSQAITLCLSPYLNLKVFTFYELLNILEKVYLTIQDVCYVVLAEQSGILIATWPDNYVTSNISFDTPVKLDLYDSIISHSNLYLAYDYLTQSKDVLDILVSAFLADKSHIYVYIGIKHNTDSLLGWSLIYTCFISLCVFLVIWLVSGCTIFINFLMINNDVQSIRAAMQRICLGDFRVNVSSRNLGGLIELASDFNNMTNRLELYEINNVYQLVLEKSKLETLLSIVGDGLIVLDQELKVVYINPAARKIWKFLKACVIGNYLYDYLPNDIIKQIRPLLDQFLESGFIYKASNSVKHVKINLKSDLSLTFQVIVVAFGDLENQMVHGIGIGIQNISNQIVLNEAKTQFISNISHELRTPLFNIRSFLETLSEYHHSLSEKQKMEFLAIANQETQRLTNLVNDVLDLSRLESEFVDILESVELYEIVPPVIQTSQLRANSKKVKLQFQISDEVASIYGYSNLITQVLSNLIGNSLKFTSVDGRILLKVYCVPKAEYVSCKQSLKIRVEIIDEGTGIDELDQNRIFDRFVRLENNVHILEGTGLGLSIVKNIVQKHQSRINIYSELLIGSSFWFDLSIVEKKS